MEREIADILASKENESNQDLEQSELEPGPRKIDRVFKIDESVQRENTMTSKESNYLQMPKQNMEENLIDSSLGPSGIIAQNSDFILQQQ